MRKLVVSLMLIMFFFAASYNVRANSSVMESTVTPFLNALHVGKMEALTPYVRGDLYKRMTSAFSQDAGYGTFLQNHYRDVSFAPAILEELPGSMVIRVNMESLGERQKSIDLYLEKSSSGVWYIVDQYETP